MIKLATILLFCVAATTANATSTGGSAEGWGDYSLSISNTLNQNLIISIDYSFPSEMFDPEATFPEGLTLVNYFTIDFRPENNFYFAAKTPDVGPEIPEVPIPAAAWLMGSALGFLGLRRKKKSEVIT